MNSKVLRKSAVTSVALAAAFWAAPLFALDRVLDEPQEFPVETAAMMAATAAFFEAAERAAEKQAPKLPVIGLPEVVSPAKQQSDDPVFEPLTNHGAVQHLTGYRINWYPLTQQLIGTVDYMGTWERNRNLVCGYISWDLSVPNEPVLEGVTANYVDMDELGSASPSKVHETLLEANCAFGAVDVNFAFFEPVN